MDKTKIIVVKRVTELAEQPRAGITTELENQQKSDENQATARRLTEREVVKTIGGWIDERLEQNRLAGILARQKFPERD